MEEDVEILIDPEEISGKLNSFYGNGEEETDESVEAPKEQQVDEQPDNQEDNQQTDIDNDDSGNGEQVDEQKDESNQLVDDGQQQQVDELPQNKQQILFTKISQYLKENSSMFEDVEDFDVQSGADFIKLIDGEVEKRVGKTQKLIKDALLAGVPTATIRKYQSEKQFYDSIDDDVISQQDLNGVNLRAKLIYMDQIQSGRSEDEAKEFTNYVFEKQKDIALAKRSLQSLKERNDQMIKNEEDLIIAQRKQQDELAETERKQFYTSVVDDIRSMTKFADIEITDDIKQNAIDFMANQSELANDGRTKITKLQKYINSDFKSFLKNFSLFMAMTNNGKTFNKLINKQVKKKTSSTFDELDQALKEASNDLDGNLTQLGVSRTVQNHQERSVNNINFDNIL